MKWIVKKAQLENALTVLSMVSAKNAVTCSEYIRFRQIGDRVKASLSSDLYAQMYVRGVNPYPFEESLYIDRRLFEPFIMSGKDLAAKEYEISTTESGEIIVRHGSRVAHYAKKNKAEGYGIPPKYANSKKLTITEDMADALFCGSGCATSDPITPFLNCVYVQPIDGGLQCFSTNGMIVFVTKVASKQGIQASIAFPLGLAKIAKAINMENLVWDDKSAMLSSERGKLWQAVKTEARKSFPVKSFTKMLAGFPKPICKIDLSSLGKASDRLASCLSSVTREDLVLTLSGLAGKSKLKLRSGVSTTTFTERVALITSSKVDFSVSWPLSEVLPVLSFMGRDGEGGVYMDEENRTMLASKRTNLIVARKEKG